MTERSKDCLHKKRNRKKLSLEFKEKSMQSTQNKNGQESITYVSRKSGICCLVGLGFGGITDCKWNGHTSGFTTESCVLWIILWALEGFTFSGARTSARSYGK